MNTNNYFQMVQIISRSIHNKIMTNTNNSNPTVAKSILS